MFNSHWHDCSTVADTIVQQSLAPLFDRHWHECSTVAGKIVQQSLARLFNSHWHNFSTVTDMIVQQWLTRLFNSRRYDCSTVADMILQRSDTIVQQSLARIFNSYWHCSSTVTGRFFLFSMLAEFFNSEDHWWRIVPCTRNMAHDPCQNYVIIIQFYRLAKVSTDINSIHNSCVSLMRKKDQNTCS